MAARKILLVEDDPSLQTYLAKGLAASGFEVTTAGNGLEALQVIDRETPDVVVTDLHMPVMDGFELVARLSQAKTRIPVIVMTGIPGAGDRLESAGNAVLLQKPVNYRLIAQQVEHVLNPAAGLVSGISLAGFLQILHWERKSCSVTVRSRGREGRVFLVEGEVVDAEEGVAGGLDAAVVLLGWESPEIQIHRAEPRRPSIDLPLMEVLMEAARLRDEGARIGPTPTQEIAIEAARLSARAAVAAPDKGEPPPQALTALLRTLSAEVPGFVGASCVEIAAAQLLGARTIPGGVDMAVASACHAEMIRTAMLWLTSRQTLDDVVFTLSDQIHVVKMLGASKFLLVVADRALTNLALLRATISKHAHLVG